MSKIPIFIRPFDSLFFRDGHAFSGSVRPVSGLPLPQTLIGALRTWLLKENKIDFKAIADAQKSGKNPEEALQSLGEIGQKIASLSLKGPWLAKSEGDKPQVFFPVPNDVQKEKDGPKLHRLKILEKPPLGWEGPEPGMMPLWLGQDIKTERCSDFIDIDGLKDWSKGKAPGKIIPAHELFGHDFRTGIGIDYQSQTVEEGLLYSSAHLVLQKDVGFYAEIECDEGLLPLPTNLFWGGEGRTVSISRCDGISWPGMPKGDKTTLLLTSPGLFAKGWRPSSVSPKAAANSPPLAISGWDMAKGGPKATRLAVPAGAVYYFEQASLPQSLCDNPIDTQHGFGTYIQGVWPQ